jgi:hypothetical protein
LPAPSKSKARLERIVSLKGPGATIVDAKVARDACAFVSNDPEAALDLRSEATTHLRELELALSHGEAQRIELSVGSAVSWARMNL